MKHSLKIIVALGLLLSTTACGNASTQRAAIGSAYTTADAGSYSSRSSNDFFFQENN